MSSMKALTLGELVNDFRAAGLEGNHARFIDLFLPAVQKAARIRASEELFARYRDDLLRFDLECADVPAIREDLQRIAALEGGQSPVVAFISGFLDRSGELLAATHACVLAIAEGKRPHIDADICIGAWMRLLPATGDTLSAKVIWTSTVEATAALARERGLSCFLLPDYIEPLVTRSSVRFLSFHTAYSQPDVVHFKPGDLPYSVIIDEGGYSGWSTLAQADLASLPLPGEDEAERFFEEHRSAVLSSNISKYAQKGMGGETALPEDYVFVALQMINDRTQAMARVPMLDMLDIVIRRFRGTGTKVVVKRHPKCTSPLVAERLRQLLDAGEIVPGDMSIHTLIANSRAVCTVNSGVGSESIIHMKPVYLFGAADYNCIAHRIGGEADFVAATQEIALPCSESELKKFLFFYRNRYQVPVTDRPALDSVLRHKLFAGTDA